MIYIKNIKYFCKKYRHVYLLLNKWYSFKNVLDNSWISSGPIPLTDASMKWFYLFWLFFVVVYKTQVSFVGEFIKGIDYLQSNVLDLAF